MIFMLDNYDSFTYNLVQYIEELGQPVKVVRNDMVAVDAVLEMRPQAIVISPGPGRPEAAGISVPLVQAASGKIPILGVCLGHQAIGAALGGCVVAAPVLMHGKTSMIHHDEGALFAGVANPFQATRYHSLVLERSSLPEDLQISAWTDDGTIMGIRHKTRSMEGVQFHPESILTGAGKALLRNFVARCAAGAAA